MARGYRSEGEDIMRVVIAMDSFKGCLDSSAAGEAFWRGMASWLPSRGRIYADIVAMGDGGEGTAAVLSAARGGIFVEAETVNPLFSSMKSGFFEWDGSDGRVCALDVASACGLSLLKGEEIDARRTSSYGVGLLMRAALERRPARLILCLGGSATIDCGMGMLGALGGKILDETGVFSPERLVGGNLAAVRGLDVREVKKIIGDTEIVIAADVNVGLLGDAYGGDEGAVEIFGLQKGIFPDETAVFRRGVENFCGVLEATAGIDVRRMRFGGAAGGIGAALHAVCSARIVDGAGFVIEETCLRELMCGADVVITGEGKSDRQTVCGKLPDAVRRVAEDCGVRTVLVSGRIDDSNILKSNGFGEQICINDGYDDAADVLNPGVASYRLMRAGHIFCRDEIRKRYGNTP